MPRGKFLNIVQEPISERDEAEGCFAHFHVNGLCVKIKSVDKDVAWVVHAIDLFSGFETAFSYDIEIAKQNMGADVNHYMVIADTIRKHRIPLVMREKAMVQYVH